MPAMSSIEIGRMARQKPSHYSRQGNLTGLKQKMYMVGNQGPRIAWGVGFQQNGAEPLQKTIPILVVPKNPPPLDSAENNMMQCPRSIDPGLSWYENIIPQKERDKNL